MHARPLEANQKGPGIGKPKRIPQLKQKKPVERIERARTVAK
jgi:hypothetical protein